jgi:hypothetical protein
MKKFIVLTLLLFLISPGISFSGKIQKTESEILMNKIDSEINALSKELNKINFLLESKQPAFIKTVFTGENDDYLYRARGGIGDNPVYFSNGFPMGRTKKPYIRKIGNIGLVLDKASGTSVIVSFPFINYNDKKNLSEMVRNSKLLNNSDKQLIEKELKDTFQQLQVKVMKASNIAEDVYKASTPCGKQYQCRTEKSIWKILGGGGIPGGFDLYGLHYAFKVEDYNDRYELNKILQDQVAKGSATFKKQPDVIMGYYKNINKFDEYTDKISESKIYFNSETGKGNWINWRSLEILKLANESNIAKNTRQIENNLQYLVHEYKIARLKEYEKSVKKASVDPSKKATF